MSSHYENIEWGAVPATTRRRRIAEVDLPCPLSRVSKKSAADIKVALAAKKETSHRRCKTKRGREREKGGGEPGNPRPWRESRQGEAAGGGGGQEKTCGPSCDRAASSCIFYADVELRSIRRRVR
ncbi:hypothetical protein BHE74_00024751 [Ensete ventricosum]|uniref:Uncharacterized protein n=1 Tax=Ensete ventricosum TaxID=4639 RepID=A0A426YNK0_ENSVE|nr:hypothetical protein B296_00023524 [Ensete ventricosum]RWW67775.1 hypothetical protein BHE74_00024751 [Ensete ventricosum]